MTNRVVNLDEKQLNRLSDIMTRYVLEFKDYAEVDCIYYTSYEYIYHGMIGTPVIALTLISSSKDNSRLQEEVDKINKGMGIKHFNSNFGIPVIVKISASANYSFVPSNYDNAKRVSKIYHSSILFDRYGVYSRLQSSDITQRIVEQYGNNNPNIVKIKPALILRKI